MTAENSYVIVLVNNLPCNREAVCYLSQSASAEVIMLLDLPQASLNDKVITIIDLRADGEFQDLVSPRILANKLHQAGLPKIANKIELIVSDVNIKVRLIPYATALANYLGSLGYVEMTVSVPCELGNVATFIVPPNLLADQLWEVYSITHEDMKKIDVPINLAKLRQSDTKKLVWCGTDIQTWMSVPQKIYTPTPFGMKPAIIE
ncbi:hypothetical protein [Aquicella lusitana]|uniref:hypothetical protein n=1 Tax=Aquicella lusitana TaxID=254246 RepID=UPI0011C02AB4|nr:hypothetical protein [Aquicella lusitana]